jgi:DNA polymerase III epsilon subunit-like protein
VKQYLPFLHLNQDSFLENFEPSQHTQVEIISSNVSPLEETFLISKINFKSQVIFFDLESDLTNKEKIIDLYCISVVGEKNEFHSYINVDNFVKETSFFKHRMSEETIKNAPKETVVLQLFLNFLKLVSEGFEEIQLVPHNVSADTHKLKKFLAIEGDIIRFGDKSLKIIFKDSIEFFCKTIGSGNSIEKLCNKYKIPVDNNALHSAKGDVYYLLKLIKTVVIQTLLEENCSVDQYMEKYFKGIQLNVLRGPLTEKCINIVKLQEKSWKKEFTASQISNWKIPESLTKNEFSNWNDYYPALNLNLPKHSSRRLTINEKKKMIIELAKKYIDNKNKNIVPHDKDLYPN